MKKIISLFAILFIANTVSAKKVKFAVDMSTYTISPNGIHIMSDFQTLIGYTLNMDPSSTQMIQQGSTSIYTIIVNIPAFQKYEFKFVNGIYGYEAEFVPDQARVGYNFNDNRWIYVDSLANDTTFLGAVRFNENSPAGKKLVRFKVDMATAGTIPTSGVHVGTSYQTIPYDPSKIRMYSFGNNVYEIYNYVNAGTYNFIFYKGNSSVTTETVPSNCATLGKRTVVLSTDSILPDYCFNSCSICIVSGIKQNKATLVNSISPNPSNGNFTINFNGEGAFKIELYSSDGKVEFSQIANNTNQEKINTSNLSKGVYFVKITSYNGQSSVHKIVLTN